VTIEEIIDERRLDMVRECGETTRLKTTKMIPYLQYTPIKVHSLK
jgi:hypothetical protein